MEEYSFDVSQQLLALSDGFLDAMHRDPDLLPDNWMRVVLIDPEWTRRHTDPASPPQPIKISSDVGAGELWAMMVLVKHALQHAQSLLRDAPFATNPEAAEREFRSQVSLFQVVQAHLSMLARTVESKSDEDVN